MSKITYTDKVTLNEQPSIDDIYKGTSDDFNEIKRVVNQNDDNVGDLSQLTTTNKISAVGAINEINSISIAKIRTDGTQNVPANTEEKIVNIWKKELELGDYTIDLNNSRIIVENTEILEVTGVIGGSGPFWSGPTVEDENQQNISGQQNGNGYRILDTQSSYHSDAFPTAYYQLDKSKTYYVYLYVYASGDTFYLNNGMGVGGTFFCARKIK